MSCQDILRIQQRLNDAQKIWDKIEKNKEKYKSCVLDNSKIIFYEDLYNKLDLEDKQNIGSVKELRDCLYSYFKCENISYNFVKSYKELAIKRFEKGYLWNKITSEKKYNRMYKELEYIDDANSYKMVAIKYTDLYNAVKKDYSMYFDTKKDFKKVLKVYFDNNGVISTFTDSKADFEEFIEKSISKINNQ